MTRNIKKQQKSYLQVLLISNKQFQMPLQYKLQPLLLYRYLQQISLNLMDQQDFDYNNYDEEYDANQYQGYQQEYDGEYEEPAVPIGYEDRVYSHEEHHNLQERPFEILPLPMIFGELNQILKYVENLVYLKKGWCLILLKQFKWDKDFLTDDYYNKIDYYQKKIGLKQDLGNPEQFDRNVIGVCEVCCSENVPIYYNICGHNYCLQCWMGHLKASILTSAFPRCMDCDCSQPLLLETVMGLLKLAKQQGEHWRSKYEKKICEMFITTSRNYQFCTGIDCDKCIKVNSSIETVTCACGKIFCFKCQSDDHYPTKCEEKSKWMENVLKQEADSKWIAQNAKICPWCKKAVERSMGCNFMACTCGKTFCYMCSHPWQPDHKDHFKCHIYKKRPDQIVNRQKEVMQRMNHSTERYIFNQAVANNYKEIDVFSKRKYLFKVLQIELTDSQFMEHAYKFAIQCCEKLKWIYAFTYFQDLKKHKEIFDFSLGEYERYKENLLKYLAADLKMLIGEIQLAEKQNRLFEGLKFVLNEKFRALKKSIVNYYTCTKNFKDKFVQQLRKITEQLDRQKDMAEITKYKEQNPDLIMKKTKSRDVQKQEKEEKEEKQQKKGFFGNLMGGSKKQKKKKQG